MPAELFAKFWTVLPVGAAAGVLAGAFGVGGGVIAIPLARYVLGESPHVAIGSTLAMIVPTALVGLLNYLKEGKLIWPLALASGIPAMIFTMVSSALSHHVDGKYLMLALCSLMLFIGSDFATGFLAKLKNSPAAASNTFEPTRKNITGAIALGVAVGLISGMLGLGGGFLMVPSFCYFFHMSLKAAFGTSLAVVAAVSIPGAIVHGMHGHLDPALVLPLMAGSLPGAWVGSFFSLKAKEQSLKVVFGSILIVLSLWFAFQEFSKQPFPLESNTGGIIETDPLSSNSAAAT